MPRQKSTRRRASSRNRRKTPLTIEEYINKSLDEKERQDSQRLAFFADYLKYLENAREKLKEEITDALLEVKRENLEGIFYRIVDLEYSSDPLCVVGSISAPGGRFNIGSIASYYREFHALYLASDHDTAFAEKHHFLPGEKRGELSPEEMSLKQPKSFSFLRVKVRLDSYIDLRDDEALRAYLKVISKISPPLEYQHQAKAVRAFPLKTVQTLGKLRKALFDPRFKLQPTLLDMPANSQWFGHHVFLAGIQGIVFPSCRNSAGYNIAVFIDNFHGTEASVELLESAPHIPKDRIKIEEQNHEFFKHSSTPKGSLAN